MKQRYSHELSAWMRWLGIWRINTDSIDFTWGYFAPRFGFTALLNRGGYFDQRYSISLCLIWGVVMIYLPWKTSIPESCDTPRYGIDIHNNTFWIHRGGKMNDWDQCDSEWTTWALPWFSWIHDTLLVWDGVRWIFPTENEYHPPFTDGRIVETHPYLYRLKSGEVQDRIATVFMSQRAWHRKWIPIYQKFSTTIDVTFDEEVGEETGSWKGGCIGCGYEVLPGDSILKTLLRMEKDRKF